MNKKQLMKNIVTIARCATLFQDVQMQSMDITGYQAPYIPLICDNPGITQDELAKSLHVNRSSVTRQLALLEKNGFIKRNRSKTDRRAIEVYPTLRMQEVLPVLRKVYKSWKSSICNVLTAEELDCLEGLVFKLAARAEEVINT